MPIFLGVHVESLIGKVNVSSLETRVPVRNSHNFWSDRWITLKILEEFSNAVYLGVDVESLISEANVSSLETRLPVRNGHNFLSDRWISLKFLQEFPDAVFLRVDVESLLGEAVTLAWWARIFILAQTLQQKFLSDDHCVTRKF